MEMLTNGAPGSPLFKIVSARDAAHDYTANFPMRLMAKDLRYAMDEAKGNGLSLETAGTALGILNRAIESGRGDEDMAAVIDDCRKR